MKTKNITFTLKNKKYISDLFNVEITTEMLLNNQHSIKYQRGNVKLNENDIKRLILLSVKKELSDMWSEGYHCKVDEIEGRKQIKFDKLFEKLIKQYEF